MSTAGAGLKDLHQLHMQLRDVRVALERGPKQIKARQQVALKREQELSSLQEQLVHLKMTADQKSLQLKSNEAKIADLKVKLNSASSNREFDIIKGQIDADTMANSVLEDEILEALDKVDASNDSIAEAEKACETAKEEQGRFAAEVEAAAPGLQGKVDTLEEAIREAERILPTDVSEQYRRLVQAHGADALSAVENNACGVCHVALRPQLRVELNTGHIIFCHTCGRLLYKVVAVAD